MFSESPAECVGIRSLVDPAQFAELKRALTDIIDLEKDSLRFYFLGAKWHRRIEHIGAKPTYDPEGLLLI